MADPGPRTTLDQWRVLQAVADAGGFEAAAEALKRSQSSVSYAVRQLERQLPVAVFERSGRKARLTPAGEALLNLVVVGPDAAGPAVQWLAEALRRGAARHRRVRSDPPQP
jgi:DNA-binding transcriptional LysR family regulator